MLCIKMKAQDQIGLDDSVDESSAGPDLSTTVEKLLGEGDNLIGRSSRHEAAGVFCKIVGPEFCDWFAG